MTRLFDLSAWVGRMLAGFCCILLALVAISTVIDVTIRELGFQSVVGRTAFAEWSLLYIATLGSPYLVRTSGHVFVDALLKTFPRPVRWVIEKLVYLLCIAICLYLAWYAGLIGYEGWLANDYEIRSFDMPRWLIHLPIMVGFVLMAVEFLRYLIGGASMYDQATGEQDAAL